MSASLTSFLRQVPPLLVGEPVPMMIGAATKLRQLLVIPEGLSKQDEEKRRQAFNQALTAYATSPAYLKALTAPGAMRYDLDRNPIGPVDPEHAARAQGVLDGTVDPFAKRPKPKKPPKPENIIVSVKVRTVKVAIMLSAETLAGIPLPPEGQPVGEVTLNVENDAGVKLAARLNGKSVRKGQKTVAEHGGNVSVVLQGKLGSANRILEAGLSVMPKLSREPAAG